MASRAPLQVWAHEAVAKRRPRRLRSCAVANKGVARFTLLLLYNLHSSANGVLAVSVAQRLGRRHGWRLAIWAPWRRDSAGRSRGSLSQETRFDETVAKLSSSTSESFVPSASAQLCDVSDLGAALWKKLASMLPHGRKCPTRNHEISNLDGSSYCFGAAVVATYTCGGNYYLCITTEWRVI